MTSPAVRPADPPSADPASAGPVSAIAVTGLTRKYRADLALTDVSFTVPGGTITGLLGRNGAGKTTLLRILAGQEFPSSGSVRVLGAAPPRTRTCCAAWCSSARTRFTRRSRSVRRCAPRPGSTRTGTPFEGVIVIDRGRVVLDAPADILRGIATRVSGPCLAVDALAAGRPVWERRRLGSQESVVMVGPLSPDDREQARSSGLDLTPLSLQQVVVQAAAGVLASAPAAGFETERTSA